MTKQIFKDLPDTSTPLNASRLNGLLDGEEALGNIVVDSIRSKNILGLQNGTYSNSGITATVKDGIITLNGTASANSFIDIFLSNYIDWIDGTSYSICAFNTTANSNIRIRLQSSGSYDMILTNSNQVETINYADGQGIYKNKITVRIQSGTTLSSYKFKPQIEKGTTTNYAPFQNINSLQIYTTGETKIGTWIDGKPLYRKVYAITTPTVTTDGTYPTNASVNLNLSDIDIIYVKNAFIISSGSKYSLPYINKSGRTIGIFVDSSNYLQITCNSTSYSNKSGYAIVEYTKTTD